MHSNRIIDEYINMVMEDPQKYAKDYEVAKEMVANSTAYYKGKPVPFDYQPLFVDQIDLQDFNYIVDTMMSIGKKVTQHYINNPEYRKLFGFPKIIEDMILVDNGYDVEIPIARFDVFYNDVNDFKFCEINTDGSSAMNEDNVLARILLKTEAMKKFSKKYQLSYFELFDSWVEQALKLYSRYDDTNPTPNVAIMDIMESATSVEFEEFKKAFEKAGVNCEIVDVRNLEYRDGKLYNGDYRIDLIYRRLVTFELIENIDKCQAFIDAYMDKAMCTIGSIQSQVIHNKIFFKILFDDETRALLTDEEIKYIDNHIPFTGIFGGGEEVFEKVKSNKDDYIIKPMDKNASTGVYAGLDLTQEQWEDNLKRDFNKDTIYQEFVPHKITKFVEFDENGDTFIAELGNMIGLFVYNEKLAGFYSRMGRDNIISGLVDYITAPTVLAVRRDMEDLLPRINELTRISKERALTLEETREREDLRKEYILRFRAGMKETLLKVKVVDEEGDDVTEEKLKKLYDEKRKLKK